MCFEFTFGVFIAHIWMGAFAVGGQGGGGGDVDPHQRARALQGEHSGNIQGTFSEHSGNIQGTFSEWLSG